MNDSESRMSDKMGRTGCADVEYSIDGSCASGKFTPRNRMGRIHRCGDHGTEQSGQADRIYPVGRSGTAEGFDVTQSEASDPESTTSKSAVCISGILWK